MNKQTLFVVKIGGNVIDNKHNLEHFLTQFAQIPNPKILVHGGGKIATEFSKQLGIEAVMINGRRVTDEAMLKIVVMVYAGLVNKNIVALLQKANQNAIGLSGADANVIQATRRPVQEIDYGLVGDISPESVNTAFIQTILAQHISPVFSPIAHDAQGQLLNINADTIAACLAKALSQDYAVRLIYGFEKAGVLENPTDETSVINSIKPQSYENYKQSGIISGGMIPKLDNAFDALRAGVSLVQIGDAMQLLDLCQNPPVSGTAISF